MRNKRGVGTHTTARHAMPFSLAVAVQLGKPGSMVLDLRLIGLGRIRNPGIWVGLGAGLGWGVSGCEARHIFCLLLVCVELINKLCSDVQLVGYQ